MFAFLTKIDKKKKKKKKISLVMKKQKKQQKKKNKKKTKNLIHGRFGDLPLTQSSGLFKIVSGYGEG